MVTLEDHMCRDANTMFVVSHLASQLQTMCTSRTDLSTLFPAATLLQKVQVKFAISFGHSVLNCGQTNLTLTPEHMASDRVTFGVPVSSHGFYSAVFGLRLLTPRVPRVHPDGYTKQDINCFL